MFKTLLDLLQAILAEQIDPKTLQAFVHKNELYIYGADGEKLFEDVVTPEDVTKALGIEDVNQV